MSMKPAPPTTGELQARDRIAQATRDLEAKEEIRRRLTFALHESGFSVTGGITVMLDHKRGQAIVILNATCRLEGE